MKLLKVLGNKIQFLRKKRGLTQEKLAEMVDMQSNSISFVERGKTFLTVENVEKMAKALNVHPSEFYISADLSAPELQELREIVSAKLNRLDKKELLFFINYLDMYIDTHFTE